MFWNAVLPWCTTARRLRPGTARRAASCERRVDTPKGSLANDLKPTTSWMSSSATGTTLTPSPSSASTKLRSSLAYPVSSQT